MSEIELFLIHALQKPSACMPTKNKKTSTLSACGLVTPSTPLRVLAVTLVICTCCRPGMKEIGARGDEWSSDQEQQHIFGLAEIRTILD